MIADQRPKAETSTISMAIKTDQIARLDQLAVKWGITRNSLMRFAMIWALLNPPADVQRLVELHRSFKGLPQSMGVNLHASDIAQLRQLAATNGITLSRLMNIAVIQFLQQIDDQTLDLSQFIEIPPQKNILKMPR
jgi:hypothetical protein